MEELVKQKQAEVYPLCSANVVLASPRWVYDMYDSYSLARRAAGKKLSPGLGFNVKCTFYFIEIVL
jgi:hypothetical protein